MLERTWMSDYFTSMGEDIKFTVDASPYGIGGVLYVRGLPEAFFYDKLHDEDEALLNTERGTADGQQMWECLSILVALRIWWTYWAERKAVVTIRSDNIAALTLGARLKITGPCNIIGREISMLYAEASYEPRFFEHVPGVGNVVADALSRVYDPAKCCVIPSVLRGIDSPAGLMTDSVIWPEFLPLT